MKADRTLKVSEVWEKNTKKLYGNVKYALVEECDRIGIMTQILFPVLVYKWNEYNNIYSIIFFSVVFTFLTRLLTAFYRDMVGKSYEDIPIPLKRFTACDKRGFVEVSEEDGADITKYLYQLEEYLEKKGLM